MNKIALIIENFLLQFDELEKLNEAITKENSEIDKAISSFYHRVEGIEITHVSQSHKLIKELKPLLSRRREIKIETILLRSTCDTLRDKIKTLKITQKTQLIKNDEVLKEIKEKGKI